ncbi:MAG: hypothetical protein H0U74_09500 [Bradymonadaceae bacterium]|nr:hypothetical protein [Lujinxingiaceae bacterium]
MRCRLLPVFAVLVLLFVVPVGAAFAQQDAEAADEPVETTQSSNPSPIEEPGVQAPGEGVAKPNGPVRGPGGRTLRSDYPGTDASLQPSMDTARIEGISIQDGQRPEEVYDLRVKELETKIDDLKERVFRSKSRIVLLKETVLSGNLAGSRVIITHESKLGATYKIRRGLFSLDGNRVFNRIDRDGDLAGERELDIYNGTVTPGTHTVSIMLGLQGSGFGLFSYVKGYEFNLRSSCQFTAEEGKTTLLSIVTYEQGNAFTAHEDRPAVMCQVSMVDLTTSDLEAEAAEAEGK